MTVKLPYVQTYIIHKITDAIYENIHVKVEIGSVSYAFFNKLDVNEIYVEDLNADTLLYVDKLQLSVTSIGIFSGEIGFGTVKLTDGEFNLHIDTEKGTVNVQELVWKFSPPKEGLDTIPKPEKEKLSKFWLEADNVVLENFRFNMKRTPINEYNDSARINFSDLRVDSIYLSLDNILLKSDTLFFDISKLHFVETSGFKLRNLTANGYVMSTQAMLKNIRIRDAYSDVQMGFFSLSFANIKSFKYFIEQVRLDALFSDAGYVSFQSLGYFAPVLRNVKSSLAAKGFVTGTVANFKSDALAVRTLDGGVEMLIKFRMTGLPLIDETIIYGDINELRGSSTSTNRLLEEVLGKKASALRPYVTALGGIDFKGKFTGLYNDFVTTGRMRTGIGLLGVDALFTNSQQKGTTFKGRFSGLGFNVGALLKSSLLDRTSFDVSLEGGLADGRLNTRIDGEVSLLELNSYPYQNINLAGQLENSSFDGMVVVKDPNLLLDFLGKIDNLDADSIPVFDFTANIRHANLHKLNLNISKRDTISTFKGLLQANFTGQTWSTSNGTVTLNNALYFDDRGEINIGNVLFSIEQGIQSYRMKLKSEYLDADYDATASPASMVKDFSRYLAQYIPSLASDTRGDTTANNRYQIQVKAKKTGVITQVIMPELFIAEGSEVSGKLENNKLDLAVHSEKLYYGVYELKNPELKIKQQDNQVQLTVTSQEINNGRAFFIRNINIDNVIKGDSIQTTAVYDNKTEIQNSAAFNIRTLFGIKKEGGLFVDFKINPSRWVVNSTPWDVLCGGIMFDTARLSVSKFEIGYKEQRLAINGAYSSSSQDTLSLTLNAFSLSYFDDILQDQSIPYRLGGTISGRALLFDHEKQPLFYANLQASAVSTNGSLLGDIGIRSLWDNENRRLRLSTAIMRGANTLVDARGSYTPTTSDVEFAIDIDKLPVVHAEPFLVGAMSKLEGSISGKLKLEGRPGRFTLTGGGKLNDAGLTIDYLNTHYKIMGDFTSDIEKINIANASVTDDEGNAILINSGYAAHSYFKRFQFNLSMRLEDAKCLNTAALDNDMFYGKVYARGNVSIAGPLSDLKLNVAARTSRNTVFYVPLSTAMASRGGRELLTFYIPKDTVATISDEEQSFLVTKASGQENKLKRTANIDFTLNLEATRDAEVRVIFDPRTNDVLKGSGSGGISLAVNPSKDIFTVFGTYTIDRGSYTLSLPNLNFIKKDFTLDRGGVVDFNGDIANMRFNLSATYDKVVRTTLLPILPYDNINQAKIKYPIYCRVNISGTLADMKIDPEIVISNIDSDTEAKVQGVLNSDEKKLKQFLALLALNQFVPEETAGQGGSVGGLTSGSAGLANLSELVSSQLSAIFSELNLPLDFGVTYKTGVDGVSDEFDIDFSYQINDRIIARGNVGNNYNALGTESTVAGDFDIEYLWKPSITLRAFSRSNDPYSDSFDKTYNRYGGAISYQNRFSTFKELLSSIFKGKKRREAEVEAQHIKEKELRQASVDSTGKQ